MNIYYLAYGSNLNVALLKSICPNAEYIGQTILPNYALYFKGSCHNYSYLTIEQETGSYVPVCIYKITKKELPKLDKYENYPNLYRKKFIDINLNGTILRVMTYIIQFEYSYHLPSTEYVIDCVKGYNNRNFDRQLLIDAILNTYNKVPKERS